MEPQKILLLELIQNSHGVVVGKLCSLNLAPEDEVIMLTPHRHDHYSIIFLQGGEINLAIDFKNLILKSSSMLVIRPGQVHQSLPLKDVNGWTVSFETNLADKNARFAIEQLLQNQIVLPLNETDYTQIGFMINALHEATNNKITGSYHKHFIQYLLNSLLFRAVDLLYLQDTNLINSYPSRSVEITRHFNQLLKQNFRTLRRPADYADIMNITVSHLNDTLKLVSGFSCTHIIQKEVISEAQRLLFYTCKSVKEIAIELGYQDYKYFIRQFVKVTNTTPLNFRRESMLQF